MRSGLVCSFGVTGRPRRRAACGSDGDPSPGDARTRFRWCETGGFEGPGASGQADLPSRPGTALVRGPGSRTPSPARAAGRPRRGPARALRCPAPPPAPFRSAPRPQLPAPCAAAKNTRRAPPVARNSLAPAARSVPLPAGREPPGLARLTCRRPPGSWRRTWRGWRWGRGRRRRSLPRRSSPRREAAAALCAPKRAPRLARGAASPQPFTPRGGAPVRPRPRRALPAARPMAVAHPAAGRPLPPRAGKVKSASETGAASGSPGGSGRAAELSACPGTRSAPLAPAPGVGDCLKGEEAPSGDAGGDAGGAGTAAAGEGAPVVTASERQGKNAE